MRSWPAQVRQNPQAKNTLEEALSSHLDIAIQKSQLRTNFTRASRGTANPELTESTRKSHVNL
jgi:hypothetical protein